MGKACTVGFHRKEPAAQAGLGLARLSTCSRLWGMGAVPSCLAPDSGMVRAAGWWPRVCEPHKGGGWGDASALVGLPPKGTFATSWN